MTYEAGNFFEALLHFYWLPTHHNYVEDIPLARSDHSKKNQKSARVTWWRIWYNSISYI